MKSSSLQTAEPVLPASAEIGLPHSPISGEDSIGKFVQFLKKRGWLILAATAIGLTAAIIVNFMSTRLYTASAQVEIVPDRSGEFRLTQIQDFDGGDDAEKLNTEIQILESRTLALETIKSLHLESNPDFLPLPNGRPWDLSQPAVRDTLVDVFRGSLNIARQGHTTILAISFTSRNPNLASLVVNNLIDNYIERSFHDNYASTAKVSGWLSSQLNDLKGNLEKSQQQMIKYQKDLGIVGLDTKDSVITASLQEMNKQLADVEVDRMVKEARLRSIQNSPPEVIDAAAVADPALQASKQQLSQLRTQYTAMMQTYGSAYTPLRAIKAQIDQLEHNLKTAENAEIVRAEKEFEAARGNEEMLRKSLSDEEQKAFDNGQKGIQFEFARSQYEANRLLYDGLQQRLQEAGIIAGLHTTSIHVIDSADIPTYPSSPRIRINVAVGTTLGLMIGFGLALLLESLDTNLKTMTDIEQTLQMPLLAAIPSVETGRARPFRLQRGRRFQGHILVVENGRSPARSPHLDPAFKSRRASKGAHDYQHPPRRGQKLHRYAHRHHLRAQWRARPAYRRGFAQAQRASPLPHG